MGFKEWIVPQDKVFFSLLERQSSVILQAASLLRDTLNNPYDFKESVDKIRELEKQSDEVVREICYRLNRTFITPIDHEDISTLSTAYDDVLDYIEGVAVKMRMFDITQPDDVMKRFASIVVDAVREIDSVIKEMRRIKQDEMRERIGRIHMLENKSDDLFDNVIPELFKIDDVKRILIMKDIYEQLEETVDKCQDVALVVQDIVIKNS